MMCIRLIFLEKLDIFDMLYKIQVYLRLILLFFLFIFIELFYFYNFKIVFL